jgi:hypothetical protein
MFVMRGATIHSAYQDFPGFASRPHIFYRFYIAGRFLLLLVTPAQFVQISSLLFSLCMAAASEEI